MIIKGIDISEHNGYVDWKKCRESGVDFAIIRTGYGLNTLDKFFVRNIEGVRASGINLYGVYHFSYALNKNDAETEARFVLKLLKSLNIPKSTVIFFDYEYDSERYAKDNGVTLSVAEKIDIAKKFVSVCREEGYRVGIYANEDYYKNHFNSLKDFDKNVIFWYANWSINPSEGVFNFCDIHQAQENGRINGVNRDVDINYMINKVAPKEAPKKSNEEIAEEVLKGLWGNGEERKNRLISSGYSYDAIQKIVNNKVAPKEAPKKSNEEIAEEVLKGLWGNGEERKNRLISSGYSYDAIQKIVNNKVAPKDIRVSPAMSFDEKFAGDYVVTVTAVNLRYIPGLLNERNVIKILYNNDKVKCYGYYTEKNGKRWLYIQHGIYEGHVDSSFVKKL